MKARDLRDLTLAELRAKEQELTDQLFALRIQKSTGQLEKPDRLRTLRRDRARVMTVARDKEAATKAG
jgi:large subunit ribosomal protein L29